MNADKIETWGLGTQETFMDEVSLAKRGGSVSAQSLAYPKRIEA